ncbi:MAG: DUF3822 family protein [Bacteroidia bacterium]|nr:DUF3822 family protein [Bacteroidia bacterium]
MQSQIEQQVIYNYTDSDFNPSLSERYNLDVCFATNRIALTVYQKNKIWAFRYVNTAESVFELSNNSFATLLNSLEWFKLPFNQIRFFISSNNFTLVPDALFDASQAKTYLELIHKVKSDDIVLSDSLVNTQIKIVYAIPAFFKKSLELLLGREVSFNHAVSIHFLTAASIETEIQKQCLMVEFHQNYITVSQVVKNEILFLNTFAFEADTDVVYFILSVAEKQKLPATKFKIIIQGDVSASASTVALLKKYIPEVILMKRKEDVEYPLSFREFQDQQFFSTIHCLLCE